MTEAKEMSDHDLLIRLDERTTTIAEGLIKLDTKMDNHLTHHENHENGFETRFIELDKKFKDNKIDNIASKMAADESISQKDIDKEKGKKIDFKNLNDIDKLRYYLAASTEGYVGADIEAMVREAAMLALRKDIKATKVSKKHFDEAMIKIKASVSKDSMNKYEKMESEYLKSAKAALDNNGSYLG